MARRSLRGKRIIVTGASSGIGRALARVLHQAGASLLITARRRERLEQLAAELASSGESPCCVCGDLTDPQTRAGIFQVVEERWGALDALVNNAGVGGAGPFAQADAARLRQILDTNFIAPVELIRHALPWLRQGHAPIIVNIGSVLGHCAIPNKSEYCASKFALHGFSDSLRAELAGERIDVLLVSPSTTDSEFFERELDATTVPARPLGKMSAESVARQICRGMERGKADLILSPGGKGLVAINRWFPSVTRFFLARWKP